MATPPDRLLPSHRGRAEGSGTSSHPDQGDDRGDSVVRLADGRALAGIPQEHSATHLPVQGLAGQTAARRFQAARLGPAIRGGAPERTLGDGSVQDLGGARRLDDTGAGDRLLQPRVAGLAPVAQRPFRDRGVGARAGVDRAIRQVAKGAAVISAEVRQRPRVHQPKLHGPGSTLRPAPGVHPAARPGAERHGRARDPDSE
jgi:hypothetical protein